MSRGTKDLIRGSAPGGPTREPQPPVAGAASMRRRPSDGATPPMAGGGGGGPDAVAQLHAKVEAQRRELDERTDNVNAIQRNFQRLSEMYAGDRGKMEAMTAELEQCRRDLESARAERKVHAALRSEFVALQKEVATLRERGDGEATSLRAQRDELQAQVAELVAELQMMRATVEGAAQSQSAQVESAARLLAHVAEASAAADTVFADIRAVQKAAGLVAPLLGTGLPGAPIARSGGSRNGDATEEEALSRLGAIATSLAACHRSAFGAIHRTLEESSERQKGAVEEMEAARAAAEAALRNERDAALRAAADQKQIAADAATRLKEAGKLFALERQTLTSQMSDGKSVLASQLADRERELADLRAIVEGLTALEQRNASEIAALEQTIEMLRRELSVATKARDDAIASGGDASAAAAGEIAQLRSDLQQARRTIENAENDASQQRSKAERLTRQLRESEAALTAAQAAWDVERQKLLKGGASSVAATMAERQRVEAELREQIAGLHSELAAERDARRRDADAATLNRQGLERDLERHQHELAVKSDEALSLGMQVEQLTVDLREARQELEAAQRLASRLQGDSQGRSGDLEKAVADLRTKNADLQAQISGMEQTIKALAEEAKHAREAAAQAKALHAAASGDQAALQKEVGQLRSALQHANDAKAQAEARAEALQRKANASEQAASEAIARARRLEDFKDDSKQRAAELEQQMVKVDEWRGTVQALQRESVKAVKKVLAAEEACESSYSCLACMEVMKDPVVCAPCGHAYCRACLVSANNGGANKPGKGLSYCPECEDDMITHVLPSKNLDQLASRFDFRKRALRELTTMLEKTYADIEAGGGLATSPSKR